MRNVLIPVVVFGGLLMAQGPMARRGGPAWQRMPRQPAAMAQPMAGQGPAGNQALKDYLGLTGAQVEQMRNVRRQEASNMQAQAAAVRAKALELRQLVQSASPDPAKVGALTLEVKQMREKMAAARSGINDQIKAVLTSDQQAKLKPLEDAVKLGPAARQAVAMGLVDAPQAMGLAGGLAGGPAPAGARMLGRGRARL